MKLENITISAAERWEDFKGYRGTITFSGPKGKVQINAGDELSRLILEQCADAIVAASREVATELTTNILEQVETPAIESA